MRSGWFSSLLDCNSNFVLEILFFACLPATHSDRMVVVCYCCDVMCLTGCPALASVNTSSEKRCRCHSQGKLFWLKITIYV